MVICVALLSFYFFPYRFCSFCKGTTFLYTLLTFRQILMISFPSDFRHLTSYVSPLLLSQSLDPLPQLFSFIDIFIWLKAKGRAPLAI